jgi:ABC-type Zn2+ transport system substrate-binding protein/surface adhesin
VQARVRFIRVAALSISYAIPSTFAVAWDRAMSLHETIAENRLKLSANLSEMSEELSNLAKEVDKNRKQVR